MHEVQSISGCEREAVNWISYQQKKSCDCSSKVEHQTKLRPLSRVCALNRTSGIPVCGT